MYCPSCGEAVGGGDAFCRHCGSELQSDGPSATTHSADGGATSGRSRIKLTSDEPRPDLQDAVAIVEEHRDLFERIAAADLRVSEHFDRALARVDGLKEERQGQA